MSALPFERITLVGEQVDLASPADILTFTGRAVGAGRKALVANHNSHSLYLLARRPEMRAIYDQADVIMIDSMPMIAWGRLIGRPVKTAYRSTYTDWREDFWRIASANRWRVFYLGGAEGVGEAARDRLLARWPGAVIGVRHGYFDATAGSTENARVIDEINAFRPDVLLVGMGMPRQEEWIGRNYAALDRGVVFAIGAAFDYEAGVQPMPPLWTGRMGLQWAYRLCKDPRRLAVRYLVEPWTLLDGMARDLKSLIPGPAGQVRPAS
jgi:N-acetylglucosaminyldiphosphoundecaprenol N-acetyl-beta-D-mannosaminyltransferase